MRIKSKKIQVRTYADMTVTSDANGAVVLHGRMDSGECWHKPLRPQDAVQVWRRMMGETEEAMHIPSPYLDVKYDEGDETWMFSDENVLCVLDSDECMLVAWAIEKAAGIAMYNGPVHPVQDEDRKSEEKTSDVWILVSSSGPGPISRNKGFCKSLAGNAMAFASRDSALEHLREFLREEVNKCHDKIHWKELEDHGRTADDILDEIIEEGNEEQGIWMYYGTKRTFAVELVKTEVKR